jgi:hypothetical protein
MLQGQPDGAVRALDDAEEAVRIARECPYPWAERDALLLQADAYDVLAATEAAAGHPAAPRTRDRARRARDDAQALAPRLHLTDADLAEAERKAKAWLEEWVKQGKKSGDDDSMGV